MTERLLYHMAPAADWRACVEAQTPYYPPTYNEDGFIHLADDPSLLLPIANHFYRGSQGNWVVLVLDASKLSAEVRFEPAAPVGEQSGQGLLLGEQQQQPPQEREQPLFPHLYGTIDFQAVVREVAMQRGGDGAFLGIPGLL